MLIQFRFKNFASFKEETILDLRALSYKDKKNHVLKIGNNKVVKTHGIFGANASGKSNLVSALYFFESFVFNQFYNDGKREDDISRDERKVSIKNSLFRLSSEADNRQEFEILFYTNNTTYQYGFTLEFHNNMQEYSVLEEWLLANDRQIFERAYNRISAGRDYVSELKSISKAREDRLYIGILDYFGEGKVKSHIDTIKNYFKYNFNIYFELYVESSVKGLISPAFSGKKLYEDDDYRHKVEEFIRAADIGIKRIEIVLTHTDDDRKFYRIKTVHDVYDLEGGIVGEEVFDIEDESSGTIRYMAFIRSFLDSINNGGVFIVDELTARLHPVLAKFIVDLYQNEYNNKAQLIFTTHDVSLLNRDQFRRDEIAFVDKTVQGESTIYTMADLKVRSDASFLKDYLSGKYGAVPIIKDAEVLKTGAEDLYGTINQ